MSSELLDKYRSNAFSLVQTNAEGEISEGCFGWLRGIRDRAISLELRKKDGRILAFGYGWLERTEYDPDRGITLYWPNHTVQVTGVNLNTEIRPTVRLYEGLVRHRVPWMRECDQTELFKAEPETTLIESIRWE